MLGLPPGHAIMRHATGATLCSGQGQARSVGRHCRCQSCPGFVVLSLTRKVLCIDCVPDEMPRTRSRGHPHHPHKKAIPGHPRYFGNWLDGVCWMVPVPKLGRPPKMG